MDSLREAMYAEASGIPPLGDIDRAIHDVSVARRRWAGVVGATTAALVLLVALVGPPWQPVTMEPVQPQPYPTAAPQGGAVIAWGSNEYSQTDIPVEAQSGVTAIAVGAIRSLALKDGRVIAWGGRNGEGEVDVPAEARSGVTAIASGGGHSLALKDGRVIDVFNAGGRHTFGLDPVPAAAQSGVTAIAAGGHGMALKDGRVIVWAGFPAPVEAQSGVTAIAAEESLSMALKDGRVITWDSGNAPNFRASDVPIEAQSGVTAIAAGPHHGLALKDGRVIAWGNSESGATKVPVEAQSGVTAIAAGEDHSLALKDGRVIAWGNSASGATKVPVEARSGVTAIAAGGSVSMAIRAPSGSGHQSTSTEAAKTPAPLAGLPLGDPPLTPYWHDGILHVDGVEITTQFPVGEIQVAGDTVIVASKVGENVDAAWALVRGDKLEPLPATGWSPTLSADGRIMLWQSEPTADTTRFTAWDMESQAVLASQTVPATFDEGNRLQRLGVDVEGIAYWVNESSDHPVTRWDIHANTVEPTDLDLDFSKPKVEWPAPIPDLWVSFEDSYLSPDGTREIFTKCTSGDVAAKRCAPQMRVRPVGSVEPREAVTLQLPEGIPSMRLWDAVSDRGMWWVWWESNETVLLDAHTTGKGLSPGHSWLVRCSTTDGACQQVFDLGTNSSEGILYMPDWERDWAFARFPMRGDGGQP